MKSMLHEASSVLKAIQKAWEASGKPEQFSVKVLEQGEKGFLWFSKRPAIVSITYEPRSINHNRSKNNARSNSGSNVQENKQNLPGSQTANRPTNNQLRQTTNNKSPELQRSTPKSINNNKQVVNTLGEPNKKSLPVVSQKEMHMLQEQTAWTPELADNITVWLKEMIEILGKNITFTSKIEGKSLHITFAQPILESKDSERSLFMSFAYLLIQALKKKCKKKLRGFHLLITSKATQSDANQTTS